jgi:hypothetical protein
MTYGVLNDEYRARVGIQNAHNDLERTTKAGNKLLFNGESEMIETERARPFGIHR